jgi:hypothetical protein
MEADGAGKLLDDLKGVRAPGTTPPLRIIVPGDQVTLVSSAWDSGHCNISVVPGREASAMVQGHPGIKAGLPVATPHAMNHRPF